MSLIKCCVKKIVLSGLVVGLFGLSCHSMEKYPSEINSFYGAAYQKKMQKLWIDLGEIFFSGKTSFEVYFLVSQEDLEKIYEAIFLWLEGDQGRKFIYSAPELSNVLYKEQVKVLMEEVLSKKKKSWPVITISLGLKSICSQIKTDTSAPHQRTKKKEHRRSSSSANSQDII